MSLDSIVTLLLLCSALASVGLATLASTRRQLPGAVPFAVGSVALGVWALSNAVQNESTVESVKRVTLYVTFTAVCVLTTAFFRTMVDLASWPRVPRWLFVLLATPMAVTVVLTWTGVDGLMFKAIQIPAGRGPVDNTPGPWYPVHIVWAYLLIVWGLVAFTRVARNAPRRYRVQAALLVSVAVIPLAVNAAAVTRFADLGGHDPTPIAMLFTAIGLGAGILRFGLLDVQVGVLPVARNVVLEAMQDGVLVVDAGGRVLDLNPAAARLLDTTRDRATGAAAVETIPRWREGSTDGVPWRVGGVSDGEPRIVEVTVTPMAPEGRTGPSVVMVRDVTDRRRAEIALESSARRHHHQSRHDALTGLPNRTLLNERLQVLLTQTAGVDGPALMILDLDGFKAVNDTFGHQAGDEVLVEIGTRLARAAGPETTVARMAGDEFAVLVPGALAGDAARIAARLQEALRIAVRVDGTMVTLRASIGVARAPEHGGDPDALLRAADVAMYQAKREAAGLAVYASTSDTRGPERLLLREELRSAIGGGGLRLHYQPQTNRAGGVVGAEALVRWPHPSRGLLHPAQFLPLAEESDLICELTDAVLGMALGDAGRWGAADGGPRVAVNVSARDLRDPTLPDRVARALAASGQPGRVLTLEVTENALAVAHDAARQLAALRNEGVRVSLDDFGTGFSPLSTLREVPVDELKIDRSFVRGIADDLRDSALAGGLVRLGHDLGLLVVAEGVETEAQADDLRLMSCDVLQGNLLGEPRPARGTARPTATVPGQRQA